MASKIYFWLEPVENEVTSPFDPITYSYVCHLSSAALSGNYIEWPDREETPWWVNGNISKFIIENNIEPVFMVGWFSGVKSFMNDSPVIEFEGLEKVHTDSCVSMAHLFENVTVKNNLNGISN